MDFETMIKEANEVIEKTGKEKGVATALLTDNGNLHITFCNDFCQGFGEKFCEEYSSLIDMIAAGKTRISRIVSVYKVDRRNGIIVPCAWLRQFIIDMNNNNLNAEVLLGGGSVYLLEACHSPHK